MQRILEGIRSFHDHRAHDVDFISDDMVSAQRPEIMLVTCSDSRVVPEIVTRSGPGRIFTIRNAGNILPDAGEGLSEEGTIEYGINVLKIKHLVVCGHTHCGAMGALFQEDLKESAITRWIHHADEAKSRALKLSQTRDQAITRTVYENVLLQLERAARYPAVAAALDQRRIELHGWVYDIRTAAFARWDAAQGQWVDLLNKDLPLAL